MIGDRQTDGQTDRLSIGWTDGRFVDSGWMVGVCGWNKGLLIVDG